METLMANKDFLQPLLDLMNHNAEELSKRMDAQDTTLIEIKSVANQALTQAKYTNGRVTKLEKQKADDKNKKVARKFGVSPSLLYILALIVLVGLIIVATLVHAPIGGLNL
jgi:hypothetical protein